MSDLSFGIGGTLSTHAFIRVPPTVTTQELHSPFLHEYFGFSPPFSHAFPKLEPAGTSIFLPLMLSTVITGTVRGAPTEPRAATAGLRKAEGTWAYAHDASAMSARRRILLKFAEVTQLSLVTTARRAR